MASNAKVATFKRKSAPEIDPDVKDFIDALLVPLLVRCAIRDLEEENRLADSCSAIAKSPSDNE